MRLPNAKQASPTDLDLRETQLREKKNRGTSKRLDRAKDAVLERETAFICAASGAGQNVIVPAMISEI